MLVIAHKRVSLYLTRRPSPATMPQSPRSRRPRPLYSQRATSTLFEAPDPSRRGTLLKRYPYKPGSRVVTYKHHRQICEKNSDRRGGTHFLMNARLVFFVALHQPLVRSSRAPESSTASNSPPPARVRCAAGRSWRTIYHARLRVKARP